jgi:hypothetical protein
MAGHHDVHIVRELAKKYAEIAAKPIQEERRGLWRAHNSFARTRPPIYVRWLAAWPEAAESRLECEDPFWQGHERFLRQMIFQDTIGDDYIIEPWITQRATMVTPPAGAWGLEIRHIPSPDKEGSWLFDPPIKELDDAKGLVAPRHVIDEEATERDADRLHDAVGGFLEVNVERCPFYTVWHADISYDLAQLRGLEQAMWDMMDNREWLHGLVGFLRDGILRTHDEAEAAGDWGLSSHQNQAMTYAQELSDPKANRRGARRKDLWCFVAAQEMALVSPAQHEEFIFNYQKTIAEKFGLVAYGCCEDLTNKIDMLRKLPNLRRIAVTPVANVRRCAEQIGRDYVISWRPNPAEMICCGFDPAKVKRIVKQAMEDMKGCCVDITLKDVQTVQKQTGNLREWVKVVRSVADEYGSR